MTKINTDEQKRLFADWLQNTRKISQSTLLSYTEKILSKLKEIITLSNNEKVKSLNPNMYFYQTKTEFDYFLNIIKGDPNFDIINKTGQPDGGWVSTPLNHYGHFLVQNDFPKSSYADNKKNLEKTNEDSNKDEANNTYFPLNLILYGPPGTGKTYNTVLKAMSIIDNTEYKDVSDEKYSALKTRFDELKQAGQIEFVTFHQSYSYEEFVEGIKPDLNADNLGYKLENGIFKNICKNSNKPHILIIDEINRGDVSKIFGELITLIEDDKRIGNKYQMKITLPYSKETFGVPNNLYIIGTMNTADRSIALLDTALRRRFDFEEIMPRPELLDGKVIEGINLQTLLTRINERITDKYDRDHQIGHSYLIDVNTKEQLERAYKNRILPLLNEYFYNESKITAEILNCTEEELNKSDFITILTKAQNDNKK